MKKLRLVLFEKCNRACDGCCNYDWDLDALPINSGFAGYDQVFITGGEPMLKPDLIIDTVKQIRKESKAEVILYTAKSKRAFDLIAILYILDGATLTLHEPYDVEPFLELNDLILRMGITNKSLRVNIFKNVNDSPEFSPMNDADLSLWKIIENKEWIKDCPAPLGEEIKRLWA